MSNILTTNTIREPWELIEEGEKLSPTYRDIHNRTPDRCEDKVQNNKNWSFWNLMCSEAAEDAGLLELAEYHRKWSRRWAEM